MATMCTRCAGTGFLNSHQIPQDIQSMSQEDILFWASDKDDVDVQVCDCCGDGERHWYGTPGEHYNDEDPIGRSGPYAYNGGLCECH